ncbi:hypothetical protein OCAR_7198 [Afipia carboxidovorans OM5]|nr:hypothetical protein OCAR_7198 [Afipia carboxidovorans OM5]
MFSFRLLMTAFFFLNACGTSPRSIAPESQITDQFSGTFDTA